MANNYEMAVARDEAEDLADRMAECLPDLALPGARCGVGIAALMILIRRMIDALPEADRQRTRDSVAHLIVLERWSA